MLHSSAAAVGGGSDPLAVGIDVDVGIAAHPRAAELCPALALFTAEKDKRRVQSHVRSPRRFGGRICDQIMCAQAAASPLCYDELLGNAIAVSDRLFERESCTSDWWRLWDRLPNHQTDRYDV